MIIAEQFDFALNASQPASQPARPCRWGRRWESRGSKPFTNTTATTTTAKATTGSGAPHCGIFVDDDLFLDILSTAAIERTAPCKGHLQFRESLQEST